MLLFVKLKFIEKKEHVNGTRVDIFNKRYALPSLLQAFSLAFAWIRPSLNTVCFVKCSINSAYRIVY